MNGCFPLFLPPHPIHTHPAHSQLFRLQRWQVLKHRAPNSQLLWSQFKQITDRSQKSLCRSTAFVSFQSSFWYSECGRWEQISRSTKNEQCQGWGLYGQVMSVCLRRGLSNLNGLRHRQAWLGRAWEAEDTDSTPGQAPPVAWRGSAPEHESACAFGVDKHRSKSPHIRELMSKQEIALLRHVVSKKDFSSADLIFPVTWKQDIFMISIL